MNIVLFEDNQVDRLYPITLARPAYAVTCGALRLVDLARMLAVRLDATISGQVRPCMRDSQEDYSLQATKNAKRRTLWLNARLVPDGTLLNVLEEPIRNLEPFQVKVDGQIAVAMTGAETSWDQSSELDSTTIELDVRLLKYPHHVIAEHLDIMSRQLPALVEFHQYKEIQAGVFATGTPSIHEQAVLDTSHGPILIEDGATISPFAVLHGPIRIGKDSFIAPHALLKGPITISEHCKVGGEVSKSVIEDYSNKVHYGYLGSSYLGSWVNLGAGTTNSNLKNTYGTVRVEYPSGKQETGLQFLGCIIGDYTKTAIHTSIYTGKVLGVCSNVYGTVTTNVPSFSNYARSLGEVTEHPAGVMEVTQKRVFERRGIRQLERHKQLIQAMYQIEAPTRKLANQPPSL